jgi:carboxymethylenebutenolidase
MSEARIEIETDEGAIDAFVACPDAPGRRAPILLLPDDRGVTAEVENQARRLSAHNYFILAPHLPQGAPGERREAAWACLDHLADTRGVDDTRVGVLGFGSGADLALGLAAWRAERIAAVAAYGAQGVVPRMAREISSRINGVIRLGYFLGVVPPRIGVLEQALCAAGVDFDVEVCDGAPHWPDLLDFFSRALGQQTLEPATQAEPCGARLNL